MNVNKYLWGAVAAAGASVVWFAGSTASAARAPVPLAATTRSAATTPQTRPTTQTRPAPRGLRTINTPYYLLYTDVGEEDALEAQLRMTRMFEEYQRRTAGFAGQVQQKFPFYLFRNEKDYQAFGGPAKSAGVYMEGPEGKRLMAIAGLRTSENTWMVVQHEGFHQFVAATMKHGLPIWINEGLAEYFGAAQWTGDGFISGLIDPGRLQRVRAGVRKGFKTFKELMALSEKEWNQGLSEANYDEAWSMVHFLANADSGRYQPAFLKYMTEVNQGIEAQQAWADAFGRDTAAFQQQYAKWWLALPDDPTRLGYVKAAVQTYTSFLARATILRQSFPDAEAFITRYRPPDARVGPDLWLPPSLVALIAAAAPRMGTWTLFVGQVPRLVLIMQDGTTLTGSFAVANGKVVRVNVDITGPNGR